MLLWCSFRQLYSRIRLLIIALEGVGKRAFGRPRRATNRVILPLQSGRCRFARTIPNCDRFCYRPPTRINNSDNTPTSINTLQLDFHEEDISEALPRLRRSYQHIALYNTAPASSPLSASKTNPWPALIFR